MIKIYIENLDKSLFKEAHKRLYEIFYFYFDIADIEMEDENEELYQRLFPAFLYRTNKEKCMKAVAELREYLQDKSYTYSLDPLHQQVLWRVLTYVAEVDQDNEIFFPKQKNEQLDNDDDERFCLSDLDDVHFYLEWCFEDLDFQSIPAFLSHYKADPLNFNFHFDIDLDEYIDFMPEKLQKEYFKIKDETEMIKSLMKDLIIVEKKNGTMYSDIRAGINLDYVLIADCSLPIEEGDRIIRVLPNGLEENYIVLDRGYTEKAFGTPAHYRVKVSRSSVLETKQWTVIHNHNHGGDFANFSINSTDNSTNTNVIIKNDLEVFDHLKQSIQSLVIEEAEKSRLLKETDELKNTVGTKNFKSRYEKFISSAANHITVISPFLPILNKFLS
ncbi:hypothetical protein [Fictibacillus enclensis]|uniref:hypothetical protein n=1 Tax=Fictibacillus enclensis TaxID=1017270 RepID=UPI0024C0879F|nr:hypothetical protein [Fictibacillus enclensis]WHY71256.1 hypothetical protein QNH15_19920 [Fictibacillus enclensis]